MEKNVYFHAIANPKRDAGMLSIYNFMHNFYSCDGSFIPILKHHNNTLGQGVNKSDIDLSEIYDKIIISIVSVIVMVPI